MLGRRVFLCGVIGSLSLVNLSRLHADQTSPPAKPQSETQIAAVDSDTADEAAPSATKKSKKFTPEQTIATHKQVRNIKPAHAGAAVSLATFCLSAKGDILACVDSPVLAAASIPGKPGAKPDSNFLQVYSPDGELVREIPLEFKATAINVGPNGDVFLAGQGKLARVVDGQVIKMANTPHIGDFEKFKKQALAAARNEASGMLRHFEAQVKSVQKRIDALEEKAKSEELSKRDQAKLTALKESLKMNEEQLKMFEQSTKVAPEQEEETIRERMVVTALGVTPEDVFVSVRSTNGQGYEVWRTNHEFEEPKKVVGNLSGCCGQLDIQAREDRLFIAENGKFEVSIRDREGKKVGRFGKQDRNAIDGFGSCCNPMNVRCCSNGDVLAAESSIGNIKRFSAKGEFLGLVGKAKIGIGCKHVALAFDETRNRYYIMNVDKAHIAVLVPLAEVPVETAAEKSERLAREEFAKRFIGEWQRDGVAPKKKGKNGFITLINGLVGNETEEESDMEMPEEPADRLNFAADGKLTSEGGQFGMYGQESNLYWESQQLAGNVLEITLLLDGGEFTNAKIEVVSEDEIRLQCQNYGEGDFGKNYTFRRIKADAADKQPKETSEKKTSE